MTQRPLQRMEFFETYYYVNIVHNILDNQFDWLVNLHQWHENNAEGLFATNFKKWSNLHDFAAHVIESLIYESNTDIIEDALAHDVSYELWVDEALRRHGFASEGIREWLRESGKDATDISSDDIYDYHNELLLSGHLSELIEHLASEVFYILFGNRGLLAKFNEYVAAAVRQLDLDTLPENARASFEKPGQLKRVHIPAWAEKAVFFRDRGLCTNCLTDLSGLLSIGFSQHLDHIIPLAQGGVNDITNLQLLCSKCNQAKGPNFSPVSANYEAWYK